MVNLILFVFAVIGLTGILVESTLFAPVRDWIRAESTATTPTVINRQFWVFLNQMLSCYQCCGTWSGWFCGLFLFPNWETVFMAGFAGSFLASWAATYLTYLQARSIVELPPEQPEQLVENKNE